MNFFSITDTIKGNEKVNAAKLTFASYYNDHMVLQQAPKKCIIWGYADTGDIGKTLKVVLSANDGFHTSTHQTSIKPGKY